MAKIVYKINGLEELNKKLLKNINLNKVKLIVNQNGNELQKKIQAKADFKGHMEWEKGRGLVFKPPTGTTKKSVGLRITDGGFTAESGPTTEYAEYLEHGTRLMEAQPFIKPAFDEQKEIFKKDLKKLVE